MTDLQRFIELYKSVGIDLEPTENEDGLCLILEEGKHEKFKDQPYGYPGFGSHIAFDKEGKFICQGFFE